MEFQILGPLEVRDQRGPVALGGAKPRAVLAVLLLEPNASVSPERLALALWGEDAPPRAVKTVQVHVSRLRKALGDGDAITTSPAGYRLRVRPGELDAERFEQDVERGRAALDRGAPDEAATALRAGLDEWRGPPLADLADERFAQAEVARLDELRLRARELLGEAELALGHEKALIGDLQRLVSAHPTRERLSAQLMLALYRDGRQADALDAYRAAREELVARVGVEPGPELRELHAAILRHDGSLLARSDELPRELERAMALPLEGRQTELDWLRARWQRARAGAGGVVTLHGEHGMGKSRLAAELAGEAHARGAMVLFADGAGPPDAALGVLTRARGLDGPTLLVLDDADRAPAAVQEELAALSTAVRDAPVLALALDSNGNAGPGDDTLRLAPLGLDAVHAIVTQYRPAHSDLQQPDVWFLGESRGVPRLVHELAGRWARSEALRRVATGAERTATQRADLRAMERELAADVVVLEAAARERAVAADGTSVCPFKGLASFQVADAPYFFGRERLVAELVARLVGAPLLGIVGPSGSGKSSVLRAGLLPALSEGVLPGSAHWTQVLIRPGAKPLTELRRALARVPDEPVVIAVDQFEEAFTLCEDEQERAGFVVELARLARSLDGQGAVVVAMRADFYGRCAAYPELARPLAANHVLVGAMRTDELRRAVEMPAEHAGLSVDAGLVDALIEDVDGEAGALPLLSTALLELWQARDGRRLRHSSYERAGGVRGAVARVGEDAWARLDEAQRPVARRVLLQLASVEEEGSVERRQVALSELSAESVEVVGALADARLLTVSASTVELAHEALLREWPRLRAWIQEDQDTLRVYRNLRVEAREWDRLDRDDGALLRGARLGEAREWLDVDAVGGVEGEYLAASLEHERRDRATRRRRVQIAFGVLAAGALAIGVVALVAIDQRRDATRERNTALSRSLALQSAQTLDTDPELALRLALWADQIAPTAQAASSLRQATLDYRQLAVLPADPLTAETAAYSPDGNRIVTGGDSGVAHVFDAATHAPIAQRDPKLGALNSARFSPDGAHVALGFAKGTVLVGDASLGSPRTVLSAGDVAVHRVAFSPDGAKLVAALDDGTVRVVDVASGTTIATLKDPDGGAVLGADIDARGDVVAADDDGHVTLWTAGAPRVLGTAATTERDARFSPDGKLVLAVGEDGFARLWDTSTGASVAAVRVGPRKLTSAAFSRDGGRFATASYDGTVEVFNTAGAAPLLTLRGQISRVLDVGFGATGERVVSAGDDGSARIWDAGGIQAFKSPSSVDSIDVSPSGRYVATGNEDGRVRLWDPRSGKLVRSLPGEVGYTPAHFSPAADQLVIGRDDESSVQRWPLSATAPLTVLKLPKDSGVNAARFDRSGRRVVVASHVGGIIEVRDLQSGSTTRLRGAPPDIWDVRIAPDGRQVAAGTEGSDLYVWNLDRPRAPPRRLSGHRGNINAVDYSEDGRIVTGGADRTVRVWNPLTGRQAVLRGHTDEVLAVTFTPDGRHVLSASGDGTVRFWDARGGDALAVLQADEAPATDVAENRRGTIATLDINDVVRIFRCPVCGGLAQVRALAASKHPRQLTLAERARFLADSSS